MALRQTDMISLVLRRAIHNRTTYIAMSRDSGLSWDSIANFNSGSWSTTFATMGICIFEDLTMEL